MAAKRKTGPKAKARKPRATTKKKRATAPAKRPAATRKRRAASKKTRGTFSRRAKVVEPQFSEQQVSEQRQPPPQPKPPPPPVTKKHPLFTNDQFRPGQHVGEHSAADDRFPQQHLLRGELIKKWARGRTEPRRYKQPSRRRRSHDRGG